MRKIIFTALLIFLITIMISCNAERTSSNEIIVLDFDQSQAESRAMTRFPTSAEGNPFITMMGGTGEGYDDGFRMSCNAMRCLPIIPGFKRIDINELISSGSVQLKAFGFPIVPIHTELTKDGIFIRYDIKEGDRTIGRIDYYYSVLENRFSYREVVSPFFGQNAHDCILFFELKDAQLEIDNRGRISFKAGEPYDNGSAFSYYCIDLLDNATDSAVKNNHYTSFWLDSCKEAMKYSSKSVTAITYNHTAYRGENGNGIMITDDNFINASGLKRKYPETINASNRDSDFNIDFVLDFLNGIFAPGIFEKKDFTSLEDFNSNGFRFAKGFSWIDERTDKALGYPVTYDLREGKGASKFWEVQDRITEETFASDAMTDNEKKWFNELGVSTESFDGFVMDLFSKLDFPEDVIRSRKTLISDSYNI